MARSGSSNSGAEASGCAAVVLGLVVLALLMWAFAILLVLLGGAIMVGGLVAAWFIVSTAVKRRRRGNEVREMEQVIQAAAADSAQALGSALLDLDQFIRARGVGTAHEKTLYENPAAFRSTRREVEAMIARLQAAPDSQMRLHAIPEAEALRLRVYRILEGGK